MGCTFTKIRLHRGITNRTFFCRMFEFGLHYVITLYTWSSRYDSYCHIAMSCKIEFSSQSLHDARNHKFKNQGKL
jgi:hypothetical protein